MAEPLTDQPNDPPVLEVRDLARHYPIRGGLLRRQVGTVRAVDGISFSIGRRETVALVGESGSGKSTAARSILQLGGRPTSGSVRFEGTELTEMSPRQLRALRRRMQMIFQDPHSSLNPRLTVGAIVREPLDIAGDKSRPECRQRVAELLEAVGLRKEMQSRFPHEFSGGQRQRIGIARALATEPSLVIADEPFAALDVSIQAQVVNLLAELRQEFNLTYLIILHDLSMAEYISDRIAVMYLGRIVELADTRELFREPAHPYTKALLSAVPQVYESHHDRPPALRGEIPSPESPPPGCHFHPRCPFASDVCLNEPELRSISVGGRDRLVACHHAKDLLTELPVAVTTKPRV